MAEQTYMIFHPTRLAFLKWYALSFMIILIGIIIISGLPPLSFLSFEYRLYIMAFLLAAGVILILVAEVSRKIDTYAITSKRVIERTGIINTKQDAIYWEKMSNYSVKQNLFDKIFKIGTVEMSSVGGEDVPEIVLKKVPNIQKITTILNRLVDKR